MYYMLYHSISCIVLYLVASPAVDDRLRPAAGPPTPSLAPKIIWALLPGEAARNIAYTI